MRLSCKRMIYWQLWQWMLLVAVFAWLLPQQTVAADRHPEKTYLYQIQLNGSNSVRIQMPLYDENDNDYWVDEGKLTAKWKDKSNVEHSVLLFWWKADEGRMGGTDYRSAYDNDKSEVWTKFKTEAGGSFEVKQGASSNTFKLVKGDGEVRKLVYANSDGKTYDFSAVWTIPYDMYAQTVTFSWEVRIGLTPVWMAKDFMLTGLTGTTITLPEAPTIVSPQISMAMMSLSKPGILELPWFIASDKVTSAKYEYIDHNNNRVVENLQAGISNGVIELDATVPHEDLRVIVNYLDRDKNPINDVSSDAVTQPMIHVPYGLTARPLGDHNASVRLDWSINHTDYEDIAGSDFFEIQRSLTGKEEDFETISSEAFDQSVKDYTYIDSTIVRAINENMLVNGGTLDKVTYRVRRAMTQPWGWNNSYAPKVSCVVSDIHLLHIASYSAKWEDERSFTARVSWEYADGYNAVWDNRAKMMMRVTMLNQKGDTVNVQTIELTQQEREQRYKVIEVARTCVNYKVDMYVERGASPVREDITPFYFPIRTAEDWVAFRDKVEAAQGKYDVNARLYADVNAGSTMIGWNKEAAYRGNFDGNGHTLTFDIYDHAQEFVAPFRYVGNATIKNLHTAGTINTSVRYTSGLIGWTMEGTTVSIENCRSSVTLKSSVSGEGLLAGFIARQSGASVVIRNCKFDGSFEGANATNNRGFVAWVARGSSLFIDNCIFAPDHIATRLNNCHTWVGLDTENVKYSNVNSYATREYLPTTLELSSNNTVVIDNETYMVLSNESDWLKFRDAVMNNSNTNAIMMADFTVHNSVALWDGQNFSGIFDGNGHTLNMEISGGNIDNVALFRNGVACTIKNLHLIGKITGSTNHVAALVGYAGVNNGKWTDIFNCRVSASVETSGWLAGGFVGRGTYANIQNCLFDGSIWCNKAQVDGSQNWAGAFFGFRDGTPGATVTDAAVQNCLENAKWYNITHNYFNIKPWGSWGNGENSDTKNNWSYTGVAGASKVTGESVETMVSYLGNSNWEVVEGNAVPKSTSNYSLLVYQSLDGIEDKLDNSWTKEGNTINPVTMTIVEPVMGTATRKDLPDHNFYHEGNGKIDNTLMTETRQSSVVLTWEADGVVDYFQVYRRYAGSGEDGWKIIAPSVDNTGYEDKDVSPLERYEYKVRAVTDCEGLHYSETQVKAGACKNTGRVEGYVRFNDGTGLCDIEVKAVHAKEGDDDRSVEKSATTDESGHFVIDGLPYNGLASIQYDVSPVINGNIKFEPGKDTYSVTFNDESNDKSISEFTVINSHLFSGFVMYEGTSIPVKGARFKVDGHDVYNASGKLVESQYDGSFSFRVLDGQHEIKTVMEKHKFADDGYYMGTNKKRLQKIIQDEAGICFYDTTKVKLTGRIVGGSDQGNKPLDNNLSRNNLGRNLTMVMTLEGDNASWLVYDNLNTELKTRELTFSHAGGNGHQTTALVERKRMTVKPDSVTGEYMLMLPPVRWKVQQIYCEGYPTLFQEGQVSEVVDLTDCLTPVDTTYEGTFKDVDENSISQPKATYNATYNRIYHSPVEITYKQLGYDTFDYFGDKSYLSTSIGSERVEVPLATLDSESNTVHYTFGYPVFSLNRRYPIQIQVLESYPFNNDIRSGVIDVVRLGGGKVTVHNGLKDGLVPEVVQLDSLGMGYYYLTADQTVRLLTGSDALKTVTMTLEQDGTTYEAEPLKAYTLNMFALGGAKDVLVKDKPILIDILRDPPGSGSSATLSKGSRLKYSFTLDMAIKGGVSIGLTYGSKLDSYTGFVAAPEGVGTASGVMNKTDISKVFEFEYCYNAEGRRAFSYTMNVNEDISTSSKDEMVGAEADLYIGMTHNIVVQPMSTIRAIPDSVFQQMKGRLSNGQTGGIETKYGTLVDIAEGDDIKGNKYHLVRDESIGYGPEVTSQFIHSQKHLLTQLIPDKVKELRAMMFTGTAADAQAKADATNKPVYRSLVSEDDENFALANTKNGELYYYTSKMTEEPGMNYVIHLPSNATTQPVDEVAENCQVIMAWVDMIGQNEREKLAAILGSSPMANYDVDGGATFKHSEQFDSEYTISNYQSLPGVIGDRWFDNLGPDMALSASAAVGIHILSKLVDMAWAKADKKTSVNSKDGDAKETTTEVSFSGKTVKFRMLPVLNYSTKGTTADSKTYSRKESFNIAMDKKSHLNIDVYRVQTDTAFLAANGLLDTYSNQNFDEMSTYVDRFMRQKFNMSKALYPRSFVYRTRGGATANPWEDERRTLIYSPGTILDERTKKICNPTIRLDKQSVSGVSVGSPARFKVYMTNESEQPEAATGGLTMFTFYLDGNSNPNGAKLFVDGAPLTIGGTDVVLYPGKVLEKTLEVYAGEGFDYEGLTIGVASPDDFGQTMNRVSFDVHYLHEAGAVNISSPGDKWVMNTEASEDDKLGWYIPVTIDGFDRHQHNFDHIEFQYKETQRGEEHWTNVCSFYADSLLMAQASGVREMIPENGNITTRFYGEGTVIENGYDLRAVLYCRNGNEFLTSSSRILSGVKDTRRPQLFGKPEPRSGILTAGDDIVFNFSEDIEYNYLRSTTNFEVKGETNSSHISENVSIQFTGSASVESEAKRNFSGKNFTIDMMIEPDTLAGRDMPLFSHGTNGQKLQLWLTKDFRLKAVIDDNEYVSDDAIAKGIFTQVAMSVNLDEDSLRFYNGGKQLGKNKLLAHYSGTGNLIFGRTNESSRTASSYYKGRMMEARLWYRAMDGATIGNTYGGQRLTGYEMGLVDYYPMNEGYGDYAIDQTQGANARLLGANWAVPRGYSLHLDAEDHGLQLVESAMNRTKEQDYTLMFWFKTDSNGRGVLVSNGAGTKEEIGAENIFNIAFEDEKLMYRSNGFATQVPGNWSDNQWHHYAMTVNRGNNVVNIYIDKVLRSTFAADSLGGISGSCLQLGGARYKCYDDNGKVVTVDTRNSLTGNIDEVCFFAQALPLTLINKYSTKSPYGNEAGLITYLAFERQERLKNNKIALVAYPYSNKLYMDADGNLRYQLDSLTHQPTGTPIRDYVFADPISVIEKHITNETAAPVVPFEELENLKFSFVGEGHRLLVNLNESNIKLNHRNVYVTIRDIEDKRGNTMASPHTACYLVTNSRIEWLANQLDYTVKYGSGEELELPFYNNSAVSHTYKIESSVKWLTMDKSSDVLAPLGSDYVRVAISKDLNIGTYNEIIYLTDEDGQSEPFYLNLTVEGELPDWASSISGDMLENSMNVVGRVYLNNEIDTDPHDIVGAFDSNNVCHGFSNVKYSAETGESSVYLTVYDNEAQGRELYFKLWQYSTGRELMLTADDQQRMTFRADSIAGLDSPVILKGGNSFVQMMNLKKGWNWISFNVKDVQMENLDLILASLPWQENDMLTELNGQATLLYEDGRWLSTDPTQDIQLSHKAAYAVKVGKDINFPIAGEIIKAQDERTISVTKGWNAIGYTPMLNLPLETALSDYYDKAEPGDVIKSHDEFAYFTMVNGVGRWRGNLEYMKPGEGYMLLRKGSGEVSFSYPFYMPGSTFLDEWTAADSRAAGSANAKTTMTMSAVVEGFETEEGDMLIAFANGERVGQATVVSDLSAESIEPLYLSIAADAKTSIWFAIERDGDIIATTSELMQYKANAVIGSPDEPAQISFTKTSSDNGKWYTVSGVQLPTRPTAAGVYIFNGKKIVIQ